MRRVSKRETRQRGCEYCLDRVSVGESGLYVGELEKQKALNDKMREEGYLVDELSYGNCCKYSRCPYRELDKYNNYKEFLENEGDSKNILIVRLRSDVL
ncbi:hypothetical protein NE683_12265 [Bariatricus massiliensis]|uniref:Uncharacterized protein n=1 Tax=Bariatricus massiliensis TaxID=1745713 RepID=A0ABS8DI18_9FIRM|nr:hypothetical protein [Bariatricus massiliensis]MCB7306169.1 hypothetical protein [Bariatricus massiliensis]MCB7375247.1 hypothetical protein [Bariatricus massiliensis]MCB7387707.1 hypothetical protein [Bariatricus massiliensis]MCB7411868.1 hypothetical protein [Bariatricus massiliensis]MCQ5254005.1 hypothetical protein [Bariatricus massiliensis]